MVLRPALWRSRLRRDSRSRRSSEMPRPVFYWFLVGLVTIAMMPAVLAEEDASSLIAGAYHSCSGERRERLRSEYCLGAKATLILNEYHPCRL
jgi:hypothetical protein